MSILELIYLAPLAISIFMLILSNARQKRLNATLQNTHELSFLPQKGFGLWIYP